MITAVVVV